MTNQAMLLLILAGCGPSYPCPTPWGHFDSELPLDCQAVARDFDLIRALMTTIPGEEAPWSPGSSYSFVDENYPPGALLSPQAFEAVYSDQVVRVLDSRTISCPQVLDPGYQAGGCYNPVTDEITMASNDAPLQHEVFHALDHGTGGHRRWTERGYYGLITAYLHFRVFGGLP